MSSGRQGHELPAANVLSGVLAIDERINGVVPGMNDEGRDRDLFHRVKRQRDEWGFELRSISLREWL